MSADPGRLRLVIASANPDKAREMLEILRDVLDERVEFVAAARAPAGRRGGR